MTRLFTGRHMLAIMLGFFGTVIAVNMVMATLASRTFGGKVVDNSYVAGQRFNGWLEQARVQQALGWNEAVSLDAGRRVLVNVDVEASDAPLGGATIVATARHPVGHDPDQDLSFEEIAPGRYRARAPLPPGRWLVHVDMRQGNRAKRVIATLS